MFFRMLSKIIIEKTYQLAYYWMKSLKNASGLQHWTGTLDLQPVTAEHDNFEFYYLPYQETVISKGKP